jgi:hypothetical protein
MTAFFGFSFLEILLVLIRVYTTSFVWFRLGVAMYLVDWNVKSFASQLDMRVEKGRLM